MNSSAKWELIDGGLLHPASGRDLESIHSDGDWPRRSQGETRMGMIVNVYRWNHDCTNGGISAAADALCVVNVEGPFEPRAGLPAVMLMESRYGVTQLVPATFEDGQWAPTKGWFANGGNFAFTSDSRYAEALQALGGDGHSATPIFDRQD